MKEENWGRKEYRRHIYQGMLLLLGAEEWRRGAAVRDVDPKEGLIETGCDSLFGVLLL